MQNGIQCDRLCADFQVSAGKSFNKPAPLNGLPRAGTYHISCNLDNFDV